MIPTGIGFLAWRLPAVLPVERLMAALERAGASWFAFKIADGLTKHNQVSPTGTYTGNDRGLLEIIPILKQYGYQVGGWFYPYPNPTMSPGAQAGLIGERVQKLGLDFLLNDAEQATAAACWKTLQDGTPNPYRRSSAITLVSQLQGAGVSLSKGLALCSYRLPSYHPLFPFAQMVNTRDSAADFIAPQVYPIGAHNFAAQVLQSELEYRTIVRAGLPMLPFLPILPTFTQGNWEPTAADLQEGIQVAKDLGSPGVGFYNLDQAINRPEWLDAIAEAGGGVTVPPQVTGKHYRALALDGLNPRSGPGTSYADLGNVPYNTEIVTRNAWVQMEGGQYPGAWVCLQQGDNTYLEEV